MGRRSTIEQLAPELTALCNRLVREGHTIEEITAHLNEMDAGVSRSAVGRYVKGAREQMKQYQDAQAVAGQWVAQLGENPKGDVGALLAEMLKNVAFQTISQMGSADAKAPKPMDVMLLAKSIKDLESTSKASLERRERIKRAALESAADKAGEVGTRVGLSQATIDEIQKELRLL